MRDERTGKEQLTPALFPIPFGIGLMVALIGLSVLSLVLEWPVAAPLTAAAIGWSLLFGVGTPYAFYKARQAGEWPPRDPEELMAPPDPAELARRPTPSPFVAALAARLEPVLADMSGRHTLYVSGGPPLTFHGRVLGVGRATQMPSWVTVIYGNFGYVLVTPGDRRFGGPLELGPVHDALLEAGYAVPPRGDKRHEYRAEVRGGDVPRAAWLVARTLELHGARDADAIEIDSFNSW